MLWYRKLICWWYGHRIPIITGRLHTYTGDWRTMHCSHCKAYWSVPIQPMNRPRKPL